MRGVSKRCVGTSGELKLVSKRSEDRVALPCSMTGILPFMGFIHLRQIGAICPSVQPTALEKPNSTYSPNENVESNNKNRQEAGLGGGSLFEVRRFQIDVKNHIKNAHFYNKDIIFMQLTPQIPACLQILGSSVKN